MSHRHLVNALAAITLILATGPGNARALPLRHEAAISVVGSWAVVEVSLNDDPTPRIFIVDTAAGSTVVDRDLADHLHLAPAPGGASQVTGASGAATFEAAILGKLTVGGISASDLEIVTTDMGRFGKGEFHYDGIIGNDVLRRYAVTMDIGRQRMTLVEAEDPEGIWSFCQANALGPERAPGFAAANIGLSSRAAAVAIIDSGAARTVLNWPAAQGIGLSKEGPTATNGGELRGFNSVNSTASSVATISGLQFGAISFSPVEGRVSDLAVFKGFGLEHRPGIILGIDVLRQRPFGIGRNASKFCI